MPVVPSYASGASEQPLIGQTIGANLEATVARLPDGEALVSRHQDVRLSWRELNDLEAEGVRFENLAWSHWNAYP